MGTLNSIHVLELSPLSIQFIVETFSENINCLINDKDVANKILSLIEKKYIVTVYGNFNKSDQLIVTNFSIFNPDKLAKKLGF